MSVFLCPTASGDRIYLNIKVENSLAALHSVWIAMLFSSSEHPAYKRTVANVVNGIALNILNLLSLAEDSGSTWLPAMAQGTSKWQHLQQDLSDLLLSPMMSLCHQKPHAQISALRTRDKTKTIPNEM